VVSFLHCILLVGLVLALLLANILWTSHSRVSKPFLGLSWSLKIKIPRSEHDYYRLVNIGLQILKTMCVSNLEIVWTLFNRIDRNNWSQCSDRIVERLRYPNSCLYNTRFQVMFYLYMGYYSAISSTNAPLSIMVRKLEYYAMIILYLYYHIIHLRCIQDLYYAILICVGIIYCYESLILYVYIVFFKFEYVYMHTINIYYLFDNIINYCTFRRKILPNVVKFNKFNKFNKLNKCWFCSCLFIVFDFG